MAAAMAVLDAAASEAEPLDAAARALLAPQLAPQFAPQLALEPILPFARAAHSASS